MFPFRCSTSCLSENPVYAFRTIRAIFAEGALAKVKAAVAEKVEDDEELPPWDIVDEVFEDEPVIKESVRAALTEEKVPERVPVERKQVERAAVRNHKIRTDTGIEISFPAEMGSNSEYIEFVNEPNGLISIELKNIGSIENR